LRSADPVIQRQVALGARSESEPLLEDRSAACREGTREIAVVEERRDASGQLAGVAGLDQQRVVVALDDLAHGRDVRGDDRECQRHRLDKRPAEPLVEGGTEHVGRSEQLGDVVPVPQEPGTILESQAADRGGELARHVPAPSRREEDEPGPGPESGDGLDQMYVTPLELLPADGDDDLVCLGEAQSSPRVPTSLGPRSPRRPGSRPRAITVIRGRRYPQRRDRRALDRPRDRVEVIREMPGRPPIDEPDRLQPGSRDARVLEPGVVVRRVHQAGDHGGPRARGGDPPHEVRLEEDSVDDLRLLGANDPAQLERPRREAATVQEAHLEALGHDLAEDALACGLEADHDRIHSSAPQVWERLGQRAFGSSGAESVHVRSCCLQLPACGALG